MAEIEKNLRKISEKKRGGSLSPIPGKGVPTNQVPAISKPNSL
jgi:hypothetical protein